MSGKGRFISALLAVNAFFIGFAYGFNSRKVLIVDPSLPPIQTEKAPVKQVVPPVPTNQKKPVEAKKITAPAKAKKATSPKTKPQAKSVKATKTAKPAAKPKTQSRHSEPAK